MDSQEPRSTPDGNTNDSWANVVKKKQSLKRYELEFSESEGLKSVEIPTEVMENGSPLWEDFVIGRFLSTAPHEAKVHMIVNKIWTLGDKSQKIDVFEVNPTTMKFHITNITTRARVLRRGMWNMAGVPMVVTKWDPIKEKTDQDVAAVPLWVHLRNVPLNMFSWEGLSFIASAAGRPDRLHPETEACANLDVAKVFVYADLSKDLPDKIRFTKNGKHFTAEFNYPWLPHKCITCGKLGHTYAICIANQKRNDQPKKTADSVESLTEVNTTARVEKILKEGAGIGGSKEMVDMFEPVVTQTEGEIKASDTTMTQEKSKEPPENVLPVDLDIEEGQLDLPWLSPTKTGRSQNISPTLKFGQVKIASPSRYSALSDLDENGVTNQENEELQVNSETNISISECNHLHVAGNESKQQVEEVSSQRPTLPRNSKINHKFLGEGPGQTAKEKPGKTGKKNTRKPHFQ